MKKINLKLVRDIRKHKWQFWSLVLIILLGEMSYGGMTGMIGDVEASVEKTLDDLRFQDFVITLEGTVPESIVEEVAAIDNVAAVTGRLLLNTGLRLDEDVEIHARLIGMPADDQPTVNQIKIDEGSYLQRGDVLSAVLDHNFADYKAFGQGHTTAHHQWAARSGHSRRCGYQPGILDARGIIREYRSLTQ